MTDKLSKEELVQLLEPFESFVGRKCQHVASKDWYVITGVHLLESTLTPFFSYETLHKEPVRWLRPVGEFTDGRFAIGKHR
jgi:hypothetical protein